MSWILSIWRRSENLLTASVSDSELLSDLKQWAEAKGLRVEVKEQGKSKAVNS